MKLFGNYGEVEKIDCLALPEADIFINGNLLEVPPAESLATWVPANCPRRSEFDSSKELGCLSCAESMVTYEGGFAEI